MEQKKDNKGRNLKAGEDQLKDGRYRYRYIDKNGGRQAEYSWRLVVTDKTPKGKKDKPPLREIEKQIQRDLEDGISIYKSKTMTVNEMLDAYFSTKANLQDSTLSNYIDLMNKNVKPNALGKMVVANVKKSDIKTFYAYLRKDRKFATTTIQLYQNILYPAFQLAVDDSIIRLNPCKGCMKEYVRGGLSTTKYPLTRQEQSALLHFIENDNVYSKYYAMVAFMLGTGCRIGEVIGLTWDDIDFETQTVSINHQVIYRKQVETNKCRHYISLPKNKTCRTIPLQKEIYQIMHQYKKQTYFKSMYSEYSLDGYSKFVFLNSELKLYTPNTITRALHSMRDTFNAGQDVAMGDLILPDFSAHTFRHTFCTRMAENGIDIKVLQEIMGHKTIAVTMQVYNHVLEEHKKKTLENIASALVV